MAFSIRPIARTHNIKYMSLGDEAFLPLKTFLRRHAKSFQNRDIARSYVVTDEINGRRVIAYLTLVCSEINSDVQRAANDVPQTSYESLPAVKLARMAVDRRFQGSGLGKWLMEWCIAHVIESVAPHVGCRFLVVDSKQQSIGFYKKSGFTILDTPENRTKDHPVMWIDLWKTQKKIKELEASEQQQRELGIS